MSPSKRRHSSSSEKKNKENAKQSNDSDNASLCFIFNYAYVCIWGVRGYTCMSSGACRVHRMVGGP